MINKITLKNEKRFYHGRFIKGTVMQIEKSRKNGRLIVAKVP